LLLNRCHLGVATILGLLGASGSAQFPFGGPPGGGPGGNPMAEMMERVVVGTIEDLNPLQGYIQVGVPGRGSRIVIAGEKTAITHLAEIPPAELKIGDEVAVSGAPTTILAEKVQVGPELSFMDIMRALQEDAARPTPAAPAAPGSEGNQPAAGPPTSAPPGPPPQGPSAGPPVSVTLSGKVKSLEPLIITLAGGSDVAVQLPEGARVLRRAQSDLSAANVDEPIVAIGRPDEDGYLVADRIYLGESLSMGRMGSGRGRGGPPMMPMGGPGGAPGGGGQ
jgi:hypothetical protein